MAKANVSRKFLLPDAQKFASRNSVTSSDGDVMMKGTHRCAICRRWIREEGREIRRSHTPSNPRDCEVALASLIAPSRKREK